MEKVSLNVKDLIKLSDLVNTPTNNKVTNAGNETQGLGKVMEKCKEKRKSTARVVQPEPVHAIIYWVDEKKTTILPITAVKCKTKRYEGARTKISYGNALYDGIIMKMSSKCFCKLCYTLIHSPIT